MQTRYFYLEGSRQRGPIDEGKLKQLIAAGAIRPESMIWEEGSPEWVAARSLSGHFPSDPPSGETSPPMPTAGAHAKRMAAEWGRTALREAREIARATAAQIKRLVGLGSARWVDHRRSRKAVEAQAAFGQRLFDGGLGDAELRSRLAQLDGQIDSLEWTKSSTREAHAERRGLLVRLAAPFLSQSPPAGLEAEHARARDAFDSEQVAHSRAMQEQARLLPADHAQRRRVAIGGAVLGLGMLAAGWLVFGGLWNWLGSDDQPSVLIGEWEGRTDWIITFTTRFSFQKDGRVFWRQDFGAVAPKKEGSGTWLVERVEANRYSLEVINDLESDESRGWVVVFKDDDEFTITGFDAVPITVQRRQ